MLNITPLRDAEYLISSVALGIDEYYLGVGEAPGVWQGRWAAELGLAGVVEADDLRAVVEGHHPSTGVDLLEGTASGRRSLVPGRSPPGHPGGGRRDRGRGRPHGRRRADLCSRADREPPPARRGHRAALARLRESRAPESQAMRASYDWEHEHEIPEATRETMADAVAADVERFGPEAVVTLAVSHADCEDIADRVRRRLIATGHVAEGRCQGAGLGSGRSARTGQATGPCCTPASATTGESCTTDRWGP